MSVPPGAAAGASLDKFFEDVESIKDDLRDLERIQRSLHDANEGGKSLHDAAAVRALRARMEADAAAAIKKAKAIEGHCNCSRSTTAVMLTNSPGKTLQVI